MNYKIINLGCKVNTYESNFISESLTKIGYQAVSDNPAWIVINTCAVTNQAEVKTHKLINQCIKQHPDANLVVIGCYSQLYFEQLVSNENIKILLGNSGKSQVANYIKQYDNDKSITKYVKDLNNVCFEDMFINNFKGRKRAFVKIQDGCDNWCSYCIIPQTRGPVRSKPLARVIEEINSLVANGYQEVVLAGIHTGKYCDGNHNLFTLLQKIKNETKLVRCRISSIEINELTDEIINLLKSDVFAKHLHIPLQSGQDLILSKMNRHYNTTFFKNRIDYIRSVIPGISITTDLIVGHPGETDELFQSTLEFVKSVKFTNIHVFPYAKRAGTVSAGMTDIVDPIVKKERVQTILALNKTLLNDYHQQFINQTVSVIVEKQINHQYFGHSSEYLQVLINKGLNLENQLVNVKITHIDGSYLVGELDD